MNELPKLRLAKIGYARVSARDQNLELQLDALTQLGCELIYQEKASGALAACVEIDKLLAQLRPGDTVYIYKLDRLGRSLEYLLDLVHEGAGGCSTSYRLATEA